MLHFETSAIHPRLVVIADDITGAFDTGVQFHLHGSTVKVVSAAQLPQVLSGIDVLVIDAETRHTSPHATYTIIHDLTAWASAHHVPHVYIKTDSGLRGHIGMALKGALEASGCTFAAFAPAYPDMGRTTCNGQQLIDGTPLHCSVFAQDLFDPVHASSIREMLQCAGIAVQEYPLGVPYPTQVSEPTIGIFDTIVNEDFHRIAAHLQKQGQLQITAGCAAFAAHLPKVLGLPDHPMPATTVHGPLMVVCGSLNPITRAQMEYGERIGGIRFSLTQEQLLQEGYWHSPDGQAQLSAMADCIRRQATILVDTGIQSPAFNHKKADFSADSRLIASQLGQLMLRLIRMDEQQRYTPMIIGGDTLMGFLSQLCTMDVTLLGEVLPGVVHFSAQVDSQRIAMLSKSGGFGSETLLNDLIHPTDANEVKHHVCL